MRNCLIALILLVSVISTSRAQDFDVVPKVKSLEGGYRYIGHTGMNIQPAGWGVQGDVMWQVSGFKGKRPSFISIPMGFSQFNTGGSDTAVNGSALYYGWTIKHNLARDKKWIPVLSYNLLMNQLWLKGSEGRVMGHETRFDFAYEYHPGKSSLYYFVKLEYSHISFPAIGKPGSDKLDVFSVKFGVGF